jgi:hypothetical protein
MTSGDLSLKSIPKDSNRTKQLILGRFGYHGLAGTASYHNLVRMGPIVLTGQSWFDSIGMSKSPRQIYGSNNTHQRWQYWSPHSRMRNPIIAWLYPNLGSLFFPADGYLSDVFLGLYCHWWSIDYWTCPRLSVATGSQRIRQGCVDKDRILMLLWLTFDVNCRSYLANHRGRCW